jgi:peptidoglycan hydrolase-like protein with peptidoglycan-binding domain
MRNTLLAGAAILAAGVAIASAQHSPGGASQDRHQRNHDMRSRDARGHGTLGQGTLGHEAGGHETHERSHNVSHSSSSQSRRTAPQQKSKSEGLENTQRPPQRAAKRAGEPSRAETSSRTHAARSGPSNHGANDRAKSQATTRQPPEHTMGRASELESKAEPRTVKTGKTTSKTKLRKAAGDVAPKSPSGGDSASHDGRTDVRKAQTALNLQGFNVGDPDGTLGQRTKKALIAFQKQHGLQTTGKVDRATLQALETGGGQGASASSSNKDGHQKRGSAPAAGNAPPNIPAAPRTTGQGTTGQDGAAPAPTMTSPLPADRQTPAAPDGGLQLLTPDGAASSRVPAGAPLEDYKDELPEGDQRR